MCIQRGTEMLLLPYSHHLIPLLPQAGAWYQKARYHKYS